MSEKNWPKVESSRNSTETPKVSPAESEAVRAFREDRRELVQNARGEQYVTTRSDPDPFLNQKQPRSGGAH